MNLSKKNILFVFIVIFSLIFSTLLWARAGGGGGGSRGGGGGGSYSSGFSRGGGYSGSSGTRYSNGGVYVGGGGPGFVIFFLLAILVVIFFMAATRGKLQNSQSLESSSMTDNPDFPVEPDLEKKIALAFFTIQKSWSEKNLSLMRRFITDGVYQRFNAQFTMMNLLDQTNAISNIQIQRISPIASRSDGNYDVITFRIEAYAEDQFLSAKFPLLNSPGGGEDFIEYWSFIRRKDYKKDSDIFHSELCPNCSAPLQAKLIETAQCPYCSTYLNNGEYDWVLAEITQENDYRKSPSAPLPTQITERLPDFSQQLIEDRASNAFMQILIACADKNEAPLTRFTTPDALVALKKIMSETTFLYDRLFLNSVDVAGLSIQNNLCLVDLDILFSFRRVQIQNQNKSAKLIDYEIITENRKLTLIRELGETMSKGSIYTNTCSHCGATQKDSLSSVCAYCNQALNDPKTEWIVSKIGD